MNSLKKRIAPRVEALEEIALMATVGLPVVGQMPTGIGSVGSVIPSDAQALQQDSSGGFLEQYISQIEALEGRQNNVKQYAQAVIANHQVTNFDLQTTAGEVDVTLPSGITQSSDIQEAQMVLNAVRHGNLDKTYLQVMAQVNAQDVSSERQLFVSTQDSGVRAYALETFFYDMTHLQGANMLLQQKGETYTPGG